MTPHSRNCAQFTKNVFPTHTFPSTVVLTESMESKDTYDRDTYHVLQDYTEK